MNMEELNKTQLVLLVLLVSFITSIATGIITTSLLNEAPVSITRTINQVVERTIETVTPTSGSAKEVSLREEDKALLAAVADATKLVVHIEEATPTASTTPQILGVILSGEGLVVSASKNVKADTKYVAILGDNTRLPLTLTTRSEKDNLAVFKIGEKSTEESETSAL